MSAGGSADGAAAGAVVCVKLKKKHKTTKNKEIIESETE